MAILTVKEMTGVGVASAPVAAAATGDSFPVSTDERTFLHVKNASAGAITVTIPAQTVSEKVGGVGPITVGALGGSVPATTGDMFFGPFPRDYIGAGGQVQVTYSAVTSLTVEAVHMGKAD